MSAQPPPAGTFRQNVPRPPGGAAVLPPPWGETFGAAPSLPLGLVRAALAGPPPTRRTAPAQPVEAAVLVPLYAEGDGGDGGEATVVLIRRAAHLERDPGHVALPGGIVEPGEDARAAALREAEEELAMDPSSVEILAELATVERPRRQAAVAAFAGVLPGRPVLVPSPDEVEAVLEVPLGQLLAAGVAWEERWPAGTGEPVGADGPVHVVRFFSCPALGEDLLWGVTAKILWDLLERVAAVAR